MSAQLPRNLGCSEPLLKMKNHEYVPAIIQPKTTRTTAVTTIMEGFFFSIQQAKSKLDKGRSLLKTLYLKI